MAKEFKEYDEEIVSEVKITDSTKVLIKSLKENNKRVGIDIRQWYCTKNDSTLKPTQKGLRFYGDGLSELILGLLSCLNSSEQKLILEKLNNK